MNIIKTLEGISPTWKDLHAQWTLDVRHDPFKASFIGDSYWGMIRFRQDLKRDQISTIAVTINQAPRMLALLRMLVEDGECYCAEGVANKEPCAWCIAKSMIGETKAIKDAKSVGLA